LTKEFYSYANPSRYSAIFGPNSNTFAYILAAKCGISSMPNRPWTPGWGDKPAGPPPPRPLVETEEHYRF